MATTTVRVWDLPTRAFHWALVVLVVGMVVTGNIGGDAMVWHARMGYAVLTLLLFRIIWGFMGGHYSRFASFFPTPKKVIAYVKGTAPKTLGHNPLGALSVFALLGFLLLQVASGLFAEDDVSFQGPLTSLVSNAAVKLASQWHSEIGKVFLIVLVLLHVGAILFYLFKKQQNLIEPMITGDKELDTPVVSNSLRTYDGAKQRIMALVILLSCAGVVAWIVNLGNKA